MEEKRPLIDRPTVRTALLLVVLFAVGFATRFPALQFPQLYAFHGVLAAPFFSAAALWHFNRSGSVWELFVATLALAAVLGIMSAVMGLSFLFLGLCLLVAYGLTGNLNRDTRLFACSVAFGALDYVCALVAGVALGSYAFSSEIYLSIALLTLLSVSLAFLAALLFKKVERS